MNAIRLAIAPIGWSNDDMPELGSHISFEQCISEMAAAGYEGCEVGHKFPRDPELLRTALSPYHLSVASAWYSLYFTEEGRRDETIQGFLAHMNFLKAMGAEVIVVCECGHSIQGKPLPVLENKPVFSAAQWQSLIDGLHHIGKYARDNGMTIVYHHHMGTGVQTEEEIDRLMLATDPALVSLLFDTGHLFFSGHAPATTLQRHGRRIRHVHLKDVRKTILIRTRDEKLSFLDAVRAGVFTVPGDGCIDYVPLFDLLDKQQYQGWWVVEAEQDPEQAVPLVYAKMAREFLRKSVGL
ncbi:Inosose dehydratase [Aquicella siphonis]|uniref:Inosose dehydratase n=1 Tax=Aquicella siphonis TaxID=254247 RepID=A0A5E4PG89_9COXI|nr:myo-inosose-2 dehydratase [Aquicella siphonis]VVC75482.1 Inosose dehydratase [Aquicella siphonis]